jgi:hypothetical protein
MTIHQLQVSYVMEQDRILVRLNTRAGEELRLWLTRRMVKNLFPRINEVASELVASQSLDSRHDGADTRALTQFKKQESLQKADFSTPFDSQATAWPLGDAPLLATTLHITPREDGALRIVFEENIAQATASRSFEVTLGQDLLHGFLHLLESALQHADWGIGLDQEERRKEATLEDFFANTDAPRYLN